MKLFEPYRETQEPDELTRAALAEIARRSMREKRKTYAYVNNRLEGNAPSTIEAVAGVAGRIRVAGIERGTLRSAPSLVNPFASAPPGWEASRGLFVQVP